MTKSCPEKRILRSQIYQAAKEICTVFSNHNIVAYMVGGSVRDFLLFPSHIPKDIDIATEASVENIKALFPKSVLVGNSFGVCLVRHKGISFEVATFRKDGPYLDRRHPSEISIGTLEEDSKRRDFTINALYFSPIDHVILDFHNGLKDLKAKRLKCVGDANARIFEDALRILRCLRFSSNFQFEIEKSLLLAIKKHMNGLSYIPMERILDELSKICRLSQFSKLFYKYIDISLFFKSLKKKQKNNVLSIKQLNTSKEFAFSKKSNFFNIFIHLLPYYKIVNLIQLQNEFKSFPCATYDKRLCLWFVSLLGVYENAFLFFKELIKIERIESKPNKHIFEILKAYLKQNKQKILLKVISAYLKTENSFSQNDIITELRSKHIPQSEYSNIILKNRFNALGV